MPWTQALRKDQNWASDESSCAVICLKALTQAREPGQRRFHTRMTSVQDGRLLLAQHIKDQAYFASVFRFSDGSISGHRSQTLSWT